MPSPSPAAFASWYTGYTFISITISMSAVDMSTVTALVVYPVKSCKGISLHTANVLKTGFSYDRNWMIVREESSKFITLRQIPKMMFVEVHLPMELLTGEKLVPEPGDALVLSAPGMAPISVPLIPSGPQVFRSATVWGDTVLCPDEGDEVGRWLTAYLGTPARLVRYLGSRSPEPPAGSVRQCDSSYAPHTETAFADNFPCLIANEASLEELVRLTGEQLSMRRFRPNIVVKGAGAWEEDTWQQFRIGAPGIEFANVKPCDRCKIPTLDPDTAEEGLEPTITLNRERSGAKLGWDGHDRTWKNWVFFAWNAVPLKEGTISVGDTMEVLQRRTGNAFGMLASSTA